MRMIDLLKSKGSRSRVVKRFKKKLSWFEAQPRLLELVHRIERSQLRRAQTLAQSQVQSAQLRQLGERSEVGKLVELSMHMREAGECGAKQLEVEFQTQ